MKWARQLAAQALALTSQDWNQLGFSDDPQVAPTSVLSVITERTLALLAIRTVAMLSTLDDFEDLSTTTICRTMLLNIEDKWPKALTEEIIMEIRMYVERILKSYRDVPYHSREHAFHVVLSANKLLDLMLCPETHLDNGHERHNATTTTATNANGNGTTRNQRTSFVPKTFGLQRDSLLQFALLYAAFVHDVEHGGISNRQLTLEDDPISLVYNDVSCLEQQSLTIAFTEFLQPEFARFRNLIFADRQVFLDFRKAVINLVLATDIANPERMQITKDKWKTAFGEPNLGVEQNNVDDNRSARRESGITEITLPRQNIAGKESRRRSIGSLFSDITINVQSSGDEASLSETADSYEDATYILGTSKLGASGDNMDAAAGGSTNSDGGYSIGHYRSETPDPTAPLTLHKIEETDRTQNGVPIRDNSPQVSGQELGYATMPAQTTIEENEPSRSPKSEVASAAASQKSAPMRSKRMRNSRRGSTASVPEGVAAYDLMRGSLRQRRASIAVGDHIMKRLHRRLSAASSTRTPSDLISMKKFRQRLGIMRSVDLGGETIENFARKGSMCSASVGRGSLAKLKQLEEQDEPDELRATVVLETILLSADVAHNLQGWDHMLKWSHRLYWELLDANKSGRGFDPSQGWSNGQIGFFQNYMLPLAQKLGRSGVFGHNTGQIFANTVQDMIERWEIHGEEMTELLMKSRNIDSYPFR